ncbi:hypothetical protein [Porphyromonas gingivicanis]|uniref:hypothetical protein n=1 Tax=Porphyromonas gingivicanis TaxID=266762 RepID=UPI000ADF4C32|nr:hypothetical protein [Porphyromonas gingivicanis]
MKQQIVKKDFDMQKKVFVEGIVGFFAFVILLSSCLQGKKSSIKNEQQVFGQVGYLRDGIVGVSYMGTNYLHLSDFSDYSDRIVYRHVKGGSRGPSITFKFFLRDVRSDYPRYHELFDVTNYCERKPWLKRRGGAPIRPIDLCLATFEKVAITANCSFGEAYPAGSDLSPLAIFMFNDFATFVEKNFDDKEIEEPLYIKGDDVEAWKKVRLSLPYFSFFINREPDLKEGEELQLTFTFDVIDRLVSDTEHKRFQKTFTFYPSDNPL